MTRTRRRGKVARKSRVQTRRNNAMKPRVQSRRTKAVKKSVRSKRPRRSRGKQLGGMDGNGASAPGNNTPLLCQDDSDTSSFVKLDDAEVEHFNKAFEKIKAEKITKRSLITRCIKGTQHSDSVPLTTDHEAYKQIVSYLKSDLYKMDEFITNNVTKKNKSKDIYVFKADFSAISYFSGFQYSILRFEYDVKQDQVSDLRLKRS
jgi:hypothetical protein